MKSPLKALATALAVTVVMFAGLAANPARAQTKPPAYLIVEFQVTDPAGWKTYVDAARALPTLGVSMVRATKGIALSGEAPRTISIFKFSSVEEAQAFDSSPAYVALKAGRDKSSIWRSYIVEGLPN